ncbi:hypothetical protein EYZ11_007133 [Aspergillus tanneri]|nr:hypothetical protein EYZ11_007133 [Aspergillus tanneri]
MDEFDFNLAPPEFQEIRWVVGSIFIVSGTGWLVNYFTTIRTALRDRTSGVSLFSLCNNLAWETVFAVIHRPPHLVAAAVITLWLLVNVYVIYVSVKFARESGPHSSPLVRYLPAITVLGFLGFLSGHIALAMHLGPTKALYWGGMICQVTLSASALSLLIERGHTRGASFGMWLSRFTASSFGVPGLFVRAVYWPSAWGWANSILMRWLSGAFFVLDISYGIVYYYIARSERQALGGRSTIKRE